MDFRGKKVLVFGLGLLGGGLATTNWLLAQGAQVTVTDGKSRDELRSSIKKIRGKVRLVLGGQKERDFLHHDTVVVNPAIPPTNEFVRLAQRAGKRITNEALIFYDTFPGKIVGVTGTRGKTTTTHWTNYFLHARHRSTIAGNSSEKPFLKVLDYARRFEVAVAETPSFQLEYFRRGTRTPDVAVVTNVYVDHLNFHGTEERYARAKANIFRFQRKDQCVVLNFNNPWTRRFLHNPPRSQVWLFSVNRALPRSAQGVWYARGAVYFQYRGHVEKIFDIRNFARERGWHNLENLLASSLAAYLAGASWFEIHSSISSLPEVPFRQEVVFKNKRVMIINDTTATSPEGAIAAARRFRGPHTVLIAGGTDRNLDFRQWGREIPKYIKSRNLILLAGSATDKMRACLKGGYGGQVQRPRETLLRCLEDALAQDTVQGNRVVVFSPGCKSFEKFKNEFDRGRKFNAAVRKKVGG